MTELNDTDLLAEYAHTASEAAFAILVARYVDLVHSAALRFTGNAHYAQEITQAVFIILARKAGSLSRSTVLSGWLYQAARLTAANFVKGEVRRQHREQEAYMQSTLTEPDSVAWEQITPLLDEAMGRLGETDRNAIVLRFFENKTVSEVAATLKFNEAATHKRLSRALEKLRKYFVKRGVTLSATVIAGAVAANSVQAVPAGLAVTVTAAAAKGAGVSATLTALVKGTLNLMAYAKLKFALGISAAIILAGGATTAVVVKELDTPKVTEDMWLADADLNKLPPVLILRPSKFPMNSGGTELSQPGIPQKHLLRHMPFDRIMMVANPGIGNSRWVLQAQLPGYGRNMNSTNWFDLMLTLTNHPIEALREEIKDQFGLVAHVQTIETNVLVLKVARPNAPGLRSGKGDRAGGGVTRSGLSVTNAETLSPLVGLLEAVLHTPIIDQTGLKGPLDVSLAWDWHSVGGKQLRTPADQALLDQALLEQLGLELVPSRWPTEMLVIEKAK